MFTYKNANTGDEVSYPERSLRLDNLPNWELTSEPDASSEPVSSKGKADQASEKPKSGDDKATWVAYIAATTGRSEAEAADLTKAELIALAE
ncbi:hypothetical protein ACIRPH_31115 [Nocardiopsis sp. NPDC101807]|uniref:hypothetical protein n=1 Tax=Nocardiopsis sp. NPDC101807 TaxID=3364339 RepID=UPI00382A7541